MAEYPNTGTSLDHLFIDNDGNASLGDTDFIDPDSDSTKEDASIYNKQKSDFGAQIDRNAVQLNGTADDNPDDNPAQPGHYEYKKSSVIGYVVKSGERLAGSRVIIEQKLASGRRTVEGTVVAESDEYPTFAVVWADKRITVESRKHYELRNAK